MLGIGYPDRHALPHITPKKCTDREVRSPTARAGSFFDPQRPFASIDINAGPCPNPVVARGETGGLKRVKPDIASGAHV